jgi:Cation transporting ATPase, C-terminus
LPKSWPRSPIHAGVEECATGSRPCWPRPCARCCAAPDPSPPSSNGSDLSGPARSNLALTGETPAGTTLWRLLVAVDPRALQTALGTWLRARLQQPADNAAGRRRTRRVLALDGKTMRATLHGDAPMHLLSVLDHATCVVVAQVNVDAKTNEIRCFSTIGEVLTMFLGVVLAGVIGLDQSGESVAVPLLATQILWINLLTDSAPALAMGVDPPPDDVMRRPPRRLSDRVIDGEMWFAIVYIGVVMAVVTLVALDLGLSGGLIGGSGDIDHARTMAFTTLVLAQLFNCFNARSDRTSAFHHFFTNRWLWAAIALSVLLQVAAVEVPFLNKAFGTAPLPLADWLICVGLASGVLWADKAKKLVERRLRR